ncbi:MAG: hypothetical protein R2867_41970 [Caldilineaceae bacterium]
MLALAEVVLVPAAAIATCWSSPLTGVGAILIDGQLYSGWQGAQVK